MASSPALVPNATGGRDPLKTDLVYTALRAGIRDRDLPPGAALRKDELAPEFGVSRVPIGEAIARLADEGLVEVFLQHGSFVAPIRSSAVREGLFIRIGLETEAMREAARAADPSLIAALDDSLAGHVRAQRLLDFARAPLDRRSEAPPAILDRAAALQGACQHHGVTLAQAALAFPFAHPAVVSVLAGAQTVPELERNAATFAKPIPTALWRDLADAGLIRADAPTPERTVPC